MDTNEQVHQPDGTPPLNSCFSEAGEQQAKKAHGPNEQAMATTRPEGSLAQSVKPGALVKDAEQTKKQFTDLSEAIRDKSEAFECAFKDAADRWDELTPYLSQMQSLLSQRGEQRKAVLREAGLPSWTEWFEGFKKELRWKISLRAVQKKLAALRDKGNGGKDGKAEGPGQAAKPQRERPPYKRGYEGAKSEMQAQLKAAAEKQAALAGRVADLEKENEKLQGIAGGLQQQRQEGGNKMVAKFQAQVEGLKGIADLAAEAFDIINGNFGDRLMANEEGKRLVAIAKKVLAMRGKLKVC